MRRFLWICVFSAVLAAPLTTPVRADDKHDRDDQNRQARDRDGRYYDSYRRDYHTWSPQEDQAYHRYMQERHKQYRDYDRLNKKEQREYWKWSHHHPDADDRR